MTQRNSVRRAGQRRNPIALIALITLTALCCPAPAFGQVAPTPITIQGAAFSGTAGLSIPAGLAITLHQLRGQTSAGTVQLVEQRKGAVGADGRFAFAGIPTLPGDQFFVSAEYEGIQQSSLIREASETPTNLELTLPLYGLTNDAAALSVIRASHQLEPRTGELMQVIVGYFVRNTSDRVYRAAEKSADGRTLSVQIPLPVGAGGIAFPDDLQSALVTVGAATLPIVADTRPLFPGDVYRITFSYLLPYQKAATIDQDYPYGAEVVEILFPSESSLRFTSEKFTFTASVNKDVNPSRSFTQQTLQTPLKVGERLIYTIEGNPFAVRPTLPGVGDSSLVIVIALLGLGILLVGMVLIGLRRIRRSA